MIQIRSAKRKDLPQLSNLFDLYRIFYGRSSDRKACTKFLKKRLTRSQALVFVAEDNQKLIGFVLNYRQFSSVSLNQMIVLNDLYVEEDYRNKGVGKMLIDEVKRYCQKYKYKGIQLETGKDNLAGNHLYPKEGFTPIEYNFYFWSNPTLD